MSGIVKIELEVIIYVIIEKNRDHKSCLLLNISDMTSFRFMLVTGGKSHNVITHSSQTSADIVKPITSIVQR